MIKYLKIFVISYVILFPQKMYCQYHNNKLIDSLWTKSEYYGTNKIDSCRIIGEKLISYAKNINDVDGIALGFFCLSRYEDRRGDYASAAEYAMKGIELYETSNDPNEKIILKLTNQLGICYRLIGQSDIGLELLKEGLDKVKRFNLTGYDVDLLYTHLANLYLDYNKYDTVKMYCRLVKDTMPSNLNSNLLAARNNALGRAATALGNYDEAMGYHTQTLDICNRYNNQFFMASANQLISAMFLKINKIDSAIFYSKKSLHLAMKNQYYRHINSAAQVLVSGYENTGQLDSILKYMKIQVKAQDFLFGNEKVAQLLKMNNDIKLKEKDSALKLETQKSKNKIILLSFILFLAILGLFFINYRIRQKSKFNKLLEDNYLKIESKNNELERTLETLNATQAQLIQSEKMASLGELTAGIAHEIQNPLNFVNNFSELSVDLAKELKEEIELLEISLKDRQYINEIIEDLNSNQEKINHHGKRAANIVKGMLQHSRNGSNKKEPTDINNLADECIRLAYHGLRANDKSFNANIEMDFDDSIGMVDMVSQDIGRVILNIVTNAFHACSERLASSQTHDSQSNDYKPVVSINTKKINNNIIISIKDNGNGMSEKVLSKIFQPFFTTKPTGKGTGLGLSMSYDIIKAHHGEIKVNSKESEGTIFQISLPLQLI